MVSLWNLFSRRPKKRHYLVIDVGSSAIRSILVEVGPDGVFGFRKQVRHIPPFAADGEKQAGKTGEHLREIIFRFIKGLGKLPDKVIIGIAPPLANVIIETIKKERPNKRERISAREIEELIAEKFAEPVRIVVDGYDVALENVKGAAGSLIELFITYLSAREDFAKEVEGLRGSWSGLTIEIRPTPIVVASLIIRKLHQKNFVLIKIGGTDTTILLVASGAVQWVESFIFGGFNATRELAGLLGVKIGDAEDIKRHFGKLTLARAIYEKAESVLKSHTKKLAEITAELFLKKQAVLPSQVFIHGGGAKVVQVVEALSDEALFENVTFAEKLLVEVLNGEFIAEKVFANSPFRGPEDADLAALAVKAVMPDYEKDGKV